MVVISILMMDKVLRGEGSGKCTTHVAHIMERNLITAHTPAAIGESDSRNRLRTLGQAVLVPLNIAKLANSDEIQETFLQ